MNNKDFIRLIDYYEIVTITYEKTIGNHFRIIAKNKVDASIIVEDIPTYQDFQRRIKMYKRWFKEHKEYV